ncbi:MAG: DUF2235 domain-containing protein [Sphingorhabdus sp.]
MKRLIFCFDGTWNRIDSQNPTNVARIAQSVSRFDKHGIAQLIHYDEGVGTTKWSKWTGGILGWGLKDNIIEAYHFLVLNYEPGDHIIVFGFSRGAFTARSFVGMIRNCGIISRRALHFIRDARELYTSKEESKRPDSDFARQFRFDHCRHLCLPGDRDWRARQYPELDHSEAIDLEICYVGIWDTVGALGVPTHLKLMPTLRSRYRFHDTRLSSCVKRARHALAIDERRGAFEPTFWSNLHVLNAEFSEEKRYEQLLFPGTHGSVGGGGPVRGLSDAALDWVLRGARKGEVAFDTDPESPLYQMHPDHRTALFNIGGKKKSYGIRDWFSGGFRLADRDFTQLGTPDFHPSVARRFHAGGAILPEMKAYRPKSLSQWWSDLEMTQVATDINIDDDLMERKGLWDNRALRPPAETREYVVKRGDNLTKIAKAEMGSKKDWQILYLHNRNIGILFDPDELYANQKIEIPVYADLGE